MASSGRIGVPAALRRVHIDFHTPDFVDNVGASFDAERFGEVLAGAEVQQAAFFSKCHYGNSYYPTEVGHPHPGLKTDMLGQFVVSASKRNIRTFAYYSLQFDRWYGKEHPDCVQQTRPFAEPSWGPWTAVCVNGPYGDYAREQIAEVVKRYDVAGIWLDIVGYYPHCVCPRCREAYTSASGKSLPFDDAHPEKGVGPDYLHWQRMMLDEYSSGIAEMIGRLRPGCELICNTASGIREKAGGQTNQRDGQWCEEAVGNNPSSLTGMSLYSSMFDGALKPLPFEIVTQRFHKGWGDWTVRPTESMRYDAATIFAHGGAVSIGDQLYGDGSFEPIVYNRIGDTFRWLKKRQESCGKTRGAAEVAVFAQSGGFREDPGAIFYRSSLCQHGEGLFKAMLDAHIPADVISDLRLLENGRYEVLLADDNLPDDEERASELTSFVRSGGRVLSAGVGPRRYWPLLGLRDSRPLPTDVSYIKIVSTDDEDLSMPVLSRVRGCRVELENEAEIIGWWAHPLSKRTAETFFSHQHAPPGPATDQPSVWHVTRGNGSVIGIAAPTATDFWHTSYRPLCKMIVACLDKLLSGRRQVYVHGLPINTELTLRKSNEAIFVHIIVPAVSRPGVNPEGTSFYIDEPVCLRGGKLTLRVPKAASCKAASQSGKPLDFALNEQRDYVSVMLEPFSTHTVIRFELSEKQP